MFKRLFYLVIFCSLSLIKSAVAESSPWSTMPRTLFLEGNFSSGRGVRVNVTAPADAPILEMSLSPFTTTHNFEITTMSADGSLTAFRQAASATTSKKYYLALTRIEENGRELFKIEYTIKTNLRGESRPRVKVSSGILIEQTVSAEAFHGKIFTKCPDAALPNEKICVSAIPASIKVSEGSVIMNGNLFKVKSSDPKKIRAFRTVRRGELIVKHYLTLTPVVVESECSNRGYQVLYRTQSFDKNGALLKQRTPIYRGTILAACNLVIQ